jgi:hypothetical protein
MILHQSRTRQSDRDKGRDQRNSLKVWTLTELFSSYSLTLVSEISELMPSFWIFLKLARQPHPTTHWKARVRSGDYTKKQACQPHPTTHWKTRVRSGDYTVVQNSGEVARFPNFVREVYFVITREIWGYQCFNTVVRERTFSRFSTGKRNCGNSIDSRILGWSYLQNQIWAAFEMSDLN